jgi:hypothetical protein
VLQFANLGLRFGLEVGALGLLSYWGFRAFPGTGSQIVLGIGAPLAFAVLWGLVASPKAPLALSRPVKASIQVGLLLVPAWAVAHAGQPALAATFAVAVVINAVLLGLWQQ